MKDNFTIEQLEELKKEGRNFLGETIVIRSIKHVQIRNKEW